MELIVLMSKLVSNVYKTFCGIMSDLTPLLFHIIFSFFIACQARQTILKYSVFSKKLRCDFKKALAPFLTDNMRWLPQPKNSSIHSMFALQGSGFTPVVAQACHLNKNPIQFGFSHCKHLLKRHGKFINRCNRTILIW